MNEAERLGLPGSQSNLWTNWDALLLQGTEISRELTKESKRISAVLYGVHLACHCVRNSTTYRD